MLACNQNGVVGKLVFDRDSIEIWKTPGKDNPAAGWIGIFNRGKKPMIFSMSLSDLKMQQPIWLFDIWQKKELGKVSNSSPMDLQIKPNGVVFCRYSYE
jgi:alpha-galactosidase